MAHDTQSGQKSASVISFQDFKRLKQEGQDPRLPARVTVSSEQEAEWAYRSKILAMDKVELLEEMVRYQEERSRRTRHDPAEIIQGQHLFEALEKAAETQELRALARSYRRHLELELREHRKAPGGQN
jgi:hypothetical protein